MANSVIRQTSIATAEMIGTQQGLLDLLNGILLELGTVRAALGCSTPNSGLNNGVVGAGAGPLVGSATWDPANVGANATAQSTTTTVTVTGAAIGDMCEATFSLDQGGALLHAYVSAPNTVTVVLVNPTNGAINLASGTLRVVVYPQALFTNATPAMSVTL